MSKPRKITVLVLLILLMAFLLVFLLDDKYYILGKNTQGITIENSDDVALFIRECLKKHSWQITITFSVHTDDLKTIDQTVEQLMEKALEETDSPVEGDYIRYQYGGYEVKYEYTNKIGNRYDYVVKITPNYYTTTEQEKVVDEGVEKILAELNVKAEDNSMSDFDKIKKIYDYVYNTVNYDSVHQRKDNHHMKTTAYFAVKYKTAVCQGYSVLMYRLLKEAGVDARVITGTVIENGEEQLHAWNIVKIDEKYYHLDVTWDKALETDAYFLKCDESFADHVRSEKYCTEEFYQNYPMADKDYECQP